MEDIPALVGVGEVKEIFGVEIQRISRWKKTGKLPPPYAELRATTIWREADIVALKDGAVQDPPWEPVPDPPAIVGASEAAVILGVDRRQVGRWRDHPPQSGPPFPAPVTKVKATPIWRRTDIEQFAQERKEMECPE